MGRVTSDEWHNERTTGEPSSFPAQLKHLSLHITHLIWSRLSHCLCHCKTNIQYTVHTGQKYNTCHLTWPHWPEKLGREAHHPTSPRRPGLPMSDVVKRKLLSLLRSKAAVTVGEWRAGRAHKAWKGPLGLLGPPTRPTRPDQLSWSTLLHYCTPATAATDTTAYRQWGNSFGKNKNRLSTTFASFWHSTIQLIFLVLCLWLPLTDLCIFIWSPIFPFQ